VITDVRHRRIFVPADQVCEGRIVFSPKDTHYLKSVLRLRPGDSVEVFDGSREYAVQLETGSSGILIGRVQQTALRKDASESIRVTLAFACVRPGPFAEILRHGTELGVCHFIPLLSRRVTRRPMEKKERWEAIIKSACEQCGCVRCPEVEVPIVLADYLERDPEHQVRFLLSPDPHTASMLEVLEMERPSDAVVLVGPEGGFDEDEEAQARRAGFVPVSLGSHILRTETAALMAAAVLAAWRDWYTRRRAEDSIEMRSRDK
jgi:16S rRNA (uracil1498-N3)-methyltransferase